MKKYIWTDEHEEIYEDIKAIKQRLNKSINKDNYLGKSIKQLRVILQKYKDELGKEAKYILYIMIYKPDKRTARAGYVIPTGDGITASKNQAYRFDTKEEAMEQLNLLKAIPDYIITDYEISEV